MSGAGLGLGAGAEQLAELLMEGVRNPQLLAPWSWLLWLGKQQQSRVSMGMYTACWAQLHPEILPGLGTGSCCCPLLPAWPRESQGQASPHSSPSHQGSASGHQQLSCHQDKDFEQYLGCR